MIRPWMVVWHATQPATMHGFILESPEYPASRVVARAFTARGARRIEKRRTKRDLVRALRGRRVRPGYHSVERR